MTMIRLLQHRDQTVSREHTHGVDISSRYSELHCTFLVSDRSLPATRHGGRITLGSDFPVESIDPLKGFYAAVSRRSEDGKSPMGSDGW